MLPLSPKLDSAKLQICTSENAGSACKLSHASNKLLPKLFMPTPL